MTASTFVSQPGDASSEYLAAIVGAVAALLPVDFGVLNTIEVFAVDGAGNRSAPASTTVDIRQP